MGNEWWSEVAFEMVGRDGGTRDVGVGCVTHHFVECLGSECRCRQFHSIKKLRSVYCDGICAVCYWCLVWYHSYVFLYIIPTFTAVVIVRLSSLFITHVMFYMFLAGSSVWCYFDQAELFEKTDSNRLRTLFRCFCIHSYPRR